MIPIKVECGCGQHYAFDVDPVDGHMPVAVKCPACGADGTRMANQIIAEVIAVPGSPPVAVAAAGGPIRLSVPSHQATSVAAPPPPMPHKPVALPVPAAVRGADGWSGEETQVNKLGTYITVGPPILAALFSSGVFGVQVSPGLLGIIVAVGGLIGGALNIAGRGPVIAGALIGCTIATGGYGAVYWWIHDKESFRKFEVMIAFVAGVIPGFLLQAGLQAFLRKRAGQ